MYRMDRPTPFIGEVKVIATAVGVDIAVGLSLADIKRLSVCNAYYA